MTNDPLIIVFQLLRSTPKTRRRWIQEEHQVTIKKINDDRMSTIASFWSSIQPKGSSKYPTLENCAPHYSRLLRLGIIMTGKKMLINCLAFIINSAKHFSRWFLKVTLKLVAIMVTSDIPNRFASRPIKIFSKTPRQPAILILENLWLMPNTCLFIKKNRDITAWIKGVKMNTKSHAFFSSSWQSSYWS